MDESPASAREAEDVTVEMFADFKERGTSVGSESSERLTMLSRVDRTSRYELGRVGLLTAHVRLAPC